MADIQLQCLGCDHAFLVSDDQAGLLVSCPRCNRNIAVPMPAERREGAPRLVVRKGAAGVGGGMTCPSCGATMPPGAVLCVECGYDMRKGVRIGEPAGWPPYVRWLLAGAGVLIVVMLANVFLRPRPISEIAVPPPAVSTPAPVAPPPASAPVQAVAPVPLPEPAEEKEPEPPPAAPAVSEEELARLEADYRNTLKGRLDQQQPLYRPGNIVELRKLNGLVIRGKMKSVSPEGAVVVREEGEATIALAELDRESRIRCDREFREKFIEFLVKKNVRSIQPPAAP